jgi:hypothetical protein
MRHPERMDPDGSHHRVLPSPEHFQPDCAGRKCSVLLFDRMIHTLRANSTSFGRQRSAERDHALACSTADVARDTTG